MRPPSNSSSVGGGGRIGSDGSFGCMPVSSLPCGMYASTLPAVDDDAAIDDDDDGWFLSKDGDDVDVDVEALLLAFAVVVVLLLLSSSSVVDVVQR